MILSLAWACLPTVRDLRDAWPSIGLLSFAGVALFLPPLIGGLFMRRISRRGVDRRPARRPGGLGLYAGRCRSSAGQGWLPAGWMHDRPVRHQLAQATGAVRLQLRRRPSPTACSGPWPAISRSSLAVSLNTSTSLIERAQADRVRRSGHAPPAAPQPFEDAPAGDPGGRARSPAATLSRAAGRAGRTRRIRRAATIAS